MRRVQLQRARLLRINGGSVIFMTPSYVETQDQGVVVSDKRRGRQEFDYDMHDTAEEIAHWEPLAAALTSCHEIVEPAYRVADRTALQFQRQHQLLTIAAATFGTIAVLFAILQLPRIISGSVISIPVVEGIAAAIAFIAVLLGILTLRQMGWMFLRHKAERFKFLKFRFLIDPCLWGADPDKREQTAQGLKDSAEKLSELTHEDLKTWAEHGILPEEPSSLAGSRAEAYTLYKLIDYYLSKRCRSQRDYFERRAQQFSSRDRYIKALPHLLFFGSIFAALLHFSLDLFENYLQPGVETAAHSAEAATEAAPALNLTVTLILIAASLPVIGAGIRTFRSAYQLSRNTSRYKAAFEAIKLPAERLERDAKRLYELYPEGKTTVDAHDVFRDMWRCEQILEAEHREWLRLMMDTDWFG